MENAYTIHIKGLSEPVKVSRDEYEFITAMIKNRRCNHLFNIAGHNVMIGDEITLVKLEDSKENKKVWCVFTVWLEPILSEIPERNQTKKASPPPLATTRHPAKKFSLHF